MILSAKEYSEKKWAVFYMIINKISIFMEIEKF